jgi:hypothetical protein
VFEGIEAEAFVSLVVDEINHRHAVGSGHPLQFISESSDHEEAAGDADCHRGAHTCMTSCVDTSLHEADDPARARPLIPLDLSRGDFHPEFLFECHEKLYEPERVQKTEIEQGKIGISTNFVGVGDAYQDVCYLFRCCQAMLPSPIFRDQSRGDHHGWRDYTTVAVLLPKHQCVAVHAGT